MKQKYFILILLFLFVSSLHAEQELSNEHFYYYKGERFYLQIDYSRISLISEGKLFLDDVKKVLNLPAFNIGSEGRNYTRQNVIPFDENTKRGQDKEIFTTEIEFPKVLDPTGYFEIIQHLSKADNLVKIAPAYTVLGKKLGISNNFYVKLFKEEDLDMLLDLAKFNK